jgi:Integrase core domain
VRPSLATRQELVDGMRVDYWHASKKQKSELLDHLVAVTGYHRKYAVAVLHQSNHPRETTSRSSPRVIRSRRRRRTYTQEVTNALVFLWKTCDCIGSKRLHPFLRELVSVLETHGELRLPDDTKRLVLAMSRATVDRLLAPVRREHRPHGRSTTKPGTLLRKSIPIRTWNDWDDAKPGFLEIDLVAHTVESTSGDYLATLNCVDVSTAWCECMIPRNRGEQAVCAALEEIRQRMPMPLLGIDSDNGPEFINNHLKRYCDRERVTFTRSRPYKKNDQAHVEGKNWTVVRRYLGYGRYEGDLARVHINDVYKDIRLYVNFFQPVMKLVSKERVDGKVRKVYDTAQTPYQRVLTSPDVSDENKDRLRALYLTLNPVTLHRTIEQQLRHIWETHRSPDDFGKIVT